MRIFAALTVIASIALGAEAHAQRPAQVRSWQLLVDGAPGAQLSSTASAQTASSVEETITASPGAIQPALWSWLALAVDGQDPRRTATIVGVTVDAKSTAATLLAGATIRKVVFPGVDATDRSAIQIGLTLSAPAPIPTSASGTPERTGPSYVASSFRLAIEGMPTNRAVAVAPIAITMAPQAVVTATVPRGIGLAARAGMPLAPGVAPARSLASVSIAPVLVKVPLADALAFQQWLSTAPATRRAGSVQYLDTTMKQGFTVALKGLAITRVTTDPGAGRATIELTADGASVSPP